MAYTRKVKKEIIVEEKPFAIHSRPCALNPARRTTTEYIRLKRITVKNMSKSMVTRYLKVGSVMNNET